MNRITSGMIAGFIATIALSAVMLLKTMMGVMPQLDVIGMLTSMAHERLGLPATAAVGWVMHFMVGTIIYGAVFAMVNDALPGGGQIAKGTVLALIGWLIMMVILMPMMGKGFFGLNIGAIAPVMTLILHIFFGAVLGWIYGLLHRRRHRRR